VTRLPIEDVPGDGVLLRPMREDDLADLVAAASDPLVLRFLQALPDPYTAEFATHWLTGVVPATWAAGGAQFAITEPGERMLLGQLSLFDVSVQTRVGHVGYWLGAAGRGRGLASAATSAAAAWAFRHGIARLELYADVDNVASQRVALRAGFRYEGIRHAAASARDGSRRDLVSFARLATDPPGPTARVLPDLPGGALGDGVVRLEPVDETDAEDTYRLSAEPDVTASRVPPTPLSTAEVRERCREYPMRWLAGDTATMAIRVAETGAYAGEISVHRVNPLLGEAMIGYAVPSAYRGRGYASRAIRLVTRWAFDELGLHRVVAGTHAWNGASQRVLERAGFVREGVQRAQLPGADGGRVDNVEFALVRDDGRVPQDTSS
jgi:RimJ/RimL family protein N-acetyltransferase